MYPFTGCDSIYKSLRSRTYDDSFVGSNMSDYIEYEEDIHEEHLCAEDAKKFADYTKRQSQVILGAIPEGRASASLHELKIILDKAEQREDEYVIDRILTGYRDLLDEETYDVPEIDSDEFDDILAKFSSF